MIPEGLDFDVENNSDANAAGTSAVVLKETGANAVEGMIRSEQRINDWAQQKQQQKAAQIKQVNDKIKTAKIDDKGIFDADVDYFKQQRVELEDLGAQVMLAAKNGTNSPDYIKAQTAFNKKQDALITEFEASKQHRNNFVEYSKILGNDGGDGKAETYDHNASSAYADQYHKADLKTRIKMDQNLLRNKEFDMFGFTKQLLAPDKKTGLNPFQESNAQVVHEKGTDYVRSTINYGKNMDGGKQTIDAKPKDGETMDGTTNTNGTERYEYKNGEWVAIGIKDAQGQYTGYPQAKKLDADGNKRVSDYYASQNKPTTVEDKTVLPEHVYDATVVGMQNKDFRDRVNNEWSQIINTSQTDPNYQQNMAIKEAYVNSAAAKSKATGKLIDPGILYGAVHYIVPAAQEQISIKELHENPGQAAYMKADASVKGKLAAIQPIAESLADRLYPIFTQQQGVVDVHGNGTKTTIGITGMQIGPRADGKTVDNAAGNVIVTEENGNPLVLIQTPQALAQAKKEVTSLMVPIQNEINALKIEATTASPARVAVINQQLAKKNSEMAQIEKMPGSGYMKFTDLGQLADQLISGDPTFKGTDAGVVKQLLNNYGEKQKWYDPKSNTWSGIKLAKNQNYQNLTLEESKVRLKDVNLKLDEIYLKKSKLHGTAGSNQPTLDAINAEQTALLKERKDLVTKIGVNAPMGNSTLHSKSKSGKPMTSTDGGKTWKYDTK